MLTDKVGTKCQLVGDDLFVANIEKLSRGIKEGIANSILIKLNQIGSVTETASRAKTATPLSARIARVRRQIRSSPTSLSLPTADRSRRVH